MEDTKKYRLATFDDGRQVAIEETANIKFKVSYSDAVLLSVENFDTDKHGFSVIAEGIAQGKSFTVVDELDNSGIIRRKIKVANQEQQQ